MSKHLETWIKKHITGEDDFWGKDFSGPDAPKGVGSGDLVSSEVQNVDLIEKPANVSEIPEMIQGEVTGNLIGLITGVLGSVLQRIASSETKEKSDHSQK